LLMAMCIRPFRLSAFTPLDRALRKADAA